MSMSLKNEFFRLEMILKKPLRRCRNKKSVDPIGLAKADYKIMADAAKNYINYRILANRTAPLY